MDDLQFFLYALRHAPDRVQVHAFAHLVTRARVRRHTDKLATGQTVRREVGAVTIETPAVVARSLKRADPADRDWLLLVHVQREVYDDLVRRAESGLVLPGNGGVLTV